MISLPFPTPSIAPMPERAVCKSCFKGGRSSLENWKTADHRKRMAPPKRSAGPAQPKKKKKRKKTPPSPPTTLTTPIGGA